MAVDANIVLCKDFFVAELSDGRRIERRELRLLAEELCRAGVKSSHLNFDWRAGAGMITAGRQVALSAELRQLENQPPGFPAAA